MIQRIRNSKTFKGLCLTLALSIFFELVAPTQAWALTGGPAQPEFSSFTPIGTSDMVDLSSGDMNYNIPLMDVGGYPLNMAYSSGVGMDEEASWVGLGWNLSVGQITRNVRGIPDDFNGAKGDEIKYENYMKPNVTAGASFQFKPATFGADIPIDLTVGMSAMYNNYTGFTIKPSAGIQLEVAANFSVGFSVQSSPEGLCVSPNLSLHAKGSTAKERNNRMSASVGVSMHSRQGLTSMTFNAKRKTKEGKGANGEKTGAQQFGSSFNSIGSHVTFTDDLYTPTKRTGMSTKSFTVNASFGTEIFGVEGNGQITGYGTIMEVANIVENKPAFGYSNTGYAGIDGILDFNREKDGSFSINSTNLPITNYTYDLHSVQGQGVNGMYRPYRNQVGYVYDAVVTDKSTSNALGLEAGAGNNVHFGIDFESTNVNSTSQLWQADNFILQNLTEGGSYSPDYESVYYKNVGDFSADRDYDVMFVGTGDYQPIHVPFVGEKFARTAVNGFRKKYNSQGDESSIAVNGKINRSQRQLRNQSIVNITKEELDKGVGYGPCVNNGPGAYYWSDNVVLPSEAKDHHVGEVQITRNDGARYIYGLPAYNKKKIEATFSVDGDAANCSTGLVPYTQAHIDNPTGLPNDQYLERITTPGYAHTYLLTSVLSADYQDRDFDGPTPDDFGSYTKFVYKDYATINAENSITQDVYRWRMPYSDASYNEGLKTDSKDDKGSYVYGEKEIYLVDKIETKTHIAEFYYSPRSDAHGVVDEHGGIDNNCNSYKLDSIGLFSVKEYQSGNPIPIKVAHFTYSYDLCKGVPNNDDILGGDILGRHPSSGILTPGLNNGGKLTLEKIHFTYRNSRMGKYSGYNFSYCNIDPDSPAGGYVDAYNPDYNIKGYDSWGNFKLNSGNCNNTAEPTPSEFPFTEQDPSEQDIAAQTWSLTRIDLPSGGNIKVSYESDDYAYVQDQETMRMFKVAGVGNYKDGSGFLNTDASEALYGGQLANSPKKYLYVEIDAGAVAGQESKYLKGLEDAPIYFRFLMNTTKLGGQGGNEDAAKFDYVTGYFEYEEDETVHNNSPYNGDAFIFEDATTGKTCLSIPVRLVEKEGGLSASSQQLVHPISKATWHFARKYLPSHAYSNQPNGDSEDIEALVNELVSPNTFNGLIEIFNGPNSTLENKNVGRRFIKKKSWVRLANPKKYKLGGGCRVKEIRMSDVWEDMHGGTNAYQTMNYGQKYSYRLTEDGERNTSGVATYEPVGNKENPFVQPVFATTEHLLAPDEENYVEKPFGESFFPSPQVTYSRVTVSNVVAGEEPPAAGDWQVKRSHRTGRVVTEFYTSKDYPTIVDQTKLQAEEDKQEALDNLLSLNVRKHITASQGYVIHLNDMNGKQKAQWVYAEGQSAPISGVEYKYDNHQIQDEFSAAEYPLRNKGRLNNEVVVIRPDGTVGKETIGVEVDIVNDFRENKTKTVIPGININIATVIIGTIPAIVPIPIPDYTQSEDRFRSAGTTKVINTFGILKETIAHDAGASVSTRNLAWDQSTGEILLTETVDEYNDRYFTFNYPAHWYYDGMGQASRNIHFSGTLTPVTAGIYTMTDAAEYLLPGDELESGGNFGWITDVDPSTDQVTVIDKDGNMSSSMGGFKVIRSGHRNLQSAGIMNVTLMRNPLLTELGALVIDIKASTFLNTTDWTEWRIINAGAVDYSDDWEVGCECGTNKASGIYNPYRINEKGVWRTKSSRTYLAGRNHQAVLTPRQQGFFTKFEPMYYWDNSEGEWGKDFTGWTFVAEVTKYSPYGFELENMDALYRYSAAQYGYNNTFPIAVGANTKYKEIGFDGFEDRGFIGCNINSHFKFDVGSGLNSSHSHTGRYSLKVGTNSIITMEKKLDCEIEIE